MAHGPAYSAKASPVPFPVVNKKAVFISKALGATMWFWIFYRVKNDGAVIFSPDISIMPEEITTPKEQEPVSYQQQVPPNYQQKKADEDNDSQWDDGRAPVDASCCDNACCNTLTGLCCGSACAALTKLF